MALRCLLFSSDRGSAEPICQVLAGLGVEGEHCAEAVAAVEKVTHQSFQIVIIDWDKQPEAGLLLTTARERKASERALTLAIVSDEASVPKALQAGANSILRKPLVVNQVKDTLTTARDLLRAKQESAQAATAVASPGSSAPVPPRTEAGGEKILRAGEFLHSAGPAPGAQFVAESDVHNRFEQSAAEPVGPLKELEPIAASVAEEKPAPAPPPSSSEPRGLAWYLNARAGTLPAMPPQAQHAPPPPPAKPELLGFDQTASLSAGAPATQPTGDPAPKTEQHAERARRSEAALFAYMSGESKASEEPAKPRFRLGKGPMIGALALAACAIVAAPQAPWHGNVQALWARGQKATHAWLNPQPVTPAQAPAAHEDFGRAGDEYKLPVAENIPDATTDPSQIRVVPVLDPTAKKPNNGAANPDQPQGPVDAATTNPTDPAQTPAVQVQENQPPPLAAATAAPTSGPSSGGTASPDTPTTPSGGQPRSDTPAAALPPLQPPHRNPQPHNVSAPANPGIPSSLKSQMASMTPDAGGNKPVEAALPSIEPVNIPEATERGLLADQPAIPYPANAKGQQGTIVLRVLIGRDGTVQDAKFMQGSLAFARAAIDGVKQWKFKPYTMNGRAVSVQTLMTMTFKPGA
jgi:protein TonB